MNQHSDSEEPKFKRKTSHSKRMTRNYCNNKKNDEKDSSIQETPQKRTLDREFQDLLPLLVAPQINYEQIRQKLNQILDAIENQIKQQMITDLLADKKGSILNAVYMILKHQSEQNPDHFFQRDVQQQITRLKELILKMKQAILSEYFDPQLQKTSMPISECKIVAEVPKVEEEPVSQGPKIQKQIKKEIVRKIKEPVKRIQNKKIEISDINLRRKVCYAMLAHLKNYTIDEELAQTLTLKLEAFAREKDPSMTSRYGVLMFNSLNSLKVSYQLIKNKLMKKEEILSFVEDQEQEMTVWNKLTQQE